MRSSATTFDCAQFTAQFRTPRLEFFCVGRRSRDGWIMRSEAYETTNLLPDIIYGFNNDTYFGSILIIEIEYKIIENIYLVTWS